MRRFLTHYQLQLIPIAPLFIGSGDYYTAKEYIDDKQSGKCYFLDNVQLYRYLKRLDAHTSILARYEKFLLNQKPYKAGDRLGEFLTREGIGLTTLYNEGIVKYEISSQHLVSDKKSRKLNEIRRFVVDAYGNPYVPGSSLKGAIRTILCNQHFETDNPPGKCSEIPWGARNGKPFNDIFHNIRVSDSKPLSLKALSLVQKWDYSAHKDKDTPLPLFREVIRPGTPIYFTITCEGDEATRMMDNLMTLASRHYKEYFNHFLSEFTNDKVQTFSVINGEKLPYIYVGGGAGIWTKTVIKQVGSPELQRYRTGKTRMVGKGTMKLTKYRYTGKISLINNRETFFEMGKCLFKLTKIEENDYEL